MILVQERIHLERYIGHDFHSSFSLFITNDDPRTVREEVDLEDGKLWENVVVEKMESLDKNYVWDLVELPTRRNTIGRKWVFKKNINVEGKAEKYRSWLVEKGYS
jgi:hypothetical protein